MVPAALRRQFAGTSYSAEVLRSTALLAAFAALTLLLPHTPLKPPVPGVITLGAALTIAWRGGIGPALFLPPLLLVLSRYQSNQTPVFGWLTSEELTAYTVITLIVTAVGVAGQFRRRIKTVTEQHTQKLQDQARALSFAHIVFRDVEGRITEWNAGAEQMFGWTNAEAEGRDLHDLLQTRFPAPLDEIERELLCRRQWEGEVVQTRKEGTELIVSAHWILYQARDRSPIGIAEIYNDVSELRRAEEAVRESDRRKDEFLAMLAHELRNPLAPIRTGLELIKMADNDREMLDEIHNTLERQTEQLITLVDDLLDVSRITRGKLELRQCRVKLAEVIRSAVEASRPFITAAGHQLTVTIPSQPVELNADPNRLAQVVSNLLNNAAKFTTADGLIQLTAERQENDVVISVQDNGIGIPPHMRDGIFELFTQIDHRQKNGESGLGIGLTLVKSITEMHGGSIEVHSDGANEGSTFRVRLPVLTSEPMRNGAHVESAVKTATLRRRVLVVDDNKAAAEMLSLLVKKLGNEVRTAWDGREAIEIAAQFLPDIVLMDLGMPRMNGYEAATWIRKQPWSTHMKLVAISGWGQDEDRRRTKEAGFDGHLVKPAEPAELKALLADGSL